MLRSAESHAYQLRIFILIPSWVKTVKVVPWQPFTASACIPCTAKKGEGYTCCVCGLGQVVRLFFWPSKY